MTREELKQLSDTTVSGQKYFNDELIDGIYDEIENNVSTINNDIVEINKSIEFLNLQWTLATFTFPNQAALYFTLNGNCLIINGRYISSTGSYPLAFTNVPKEIMDRIAPANVIYSYNTSTNTMLEGRVSIINNTLTISNAFTANQSFIFNNSIVMLNPI